MCESIFLLSPFGFLPFAFYPACHLGENRCWCWEIAGTLGSSTLTFVWEMDMISAALLVVDGSRAVCWLGGEIGTILAGTEKKYKSCWT